MSEKPPSESGPAPYLEITQDEFAIAGSMFEVQAISGGVLLRGACPRCHDTMEFPWVDDAYRSSVSGGDGPRTVMVICTCVMTHPGVSAQGIGCGAYWNLRLED